MHRADVCKAEVEGLPMLVVHRALGAQEVHIDCLGSLTLPVVDRCRAAGAHSRTVRGFVTEEHHCELVQRKL
jgi:hypothetical protein